MTIEERLEIVEKELAGLKDQMKNKCIRANFIVLEDSDGKVCAGIYADRNEEGVSVNLVYKNALDKPAGGAQIFAGNDRPLIWVYDGKYRSVWQADVQDKIEKSTPFKSPRAKPETASNKIYGGTEDLRGVDINWRLVREITTSKPSKTNTKSSQIMLL